MPVKNIKLVEAGLVGVVPKVIYINTNDSLATVKTTGYLNKSRALGASFNNEEMALVKTTDGLVWLEVLATTSNVSLQGPEIPFDATGSGLVVLQDSPTINSPTMVTPTLGAATATSLEFDPTTGGVIGTPTNNSATAGTVGEFQSATVLEGSAVSLTTNTVTEITSISLAAGDWDVWGSGSLLASGTTVVNRYQVWVSTTLSSTNRSLVFNMEFGSGITPASSYGLSGFSENRISLSATTTVYLATRAAFTTSTLDACGYIRARRVR